MATHHRSLPVEQVCASNKVQDGGQLCGADGLHRPERCLSSGPGPSREQGKSYQFKILSFGLSPAPQVFTRIMAPVSVMLHSLEVWILFCLDNWLVLASSQTEALWTRDTVLDLCCQLGIIINLNKSHLSPSQSVTYLGMVIQSPTFKAFPSLEEVSALLLQIEELLSCRRQNVVLWRSLLGRLSSFCLLVPGGRLRMRSLQLVLQDLWDFQGESVSVVWTPSIEQDLRWWSDAQHPAGISLEPQHPDLLFWSDASDQSWGTNLVDQFVSGLWSTGECNLSINLRELRAICSVFFVFIILS